MVAIRALALMSSLPALLICAAPPAQAAITADPATITVVPSTSLGSASGTGALLLPANQDPALTAYRLSSRLRGTVGQIDYAGAAPTSYTLTYVSCPRRGAALADCLKRSTISNRGNASGAAYPDTTFGSQDLGRFMRLVVTVSAQGVPSVTTTSDPARDVLILSDPPVGGRPALPTAPAPGTSAEVRLAGWTLGVFDTYVGRTVVAYLCGSATAGQDGAAGFLPASGSCVQTTIARQPTSAAAQTVQAAIPGTAAGSYLLVSDALTFKGANGIAAAWVVRSTTERVVSPGDGTPSSSASPSPSPDPTPSPSTGGPGADGSVAVVPTITLTAPARVARGKRLAIAVAVGQSSGVGEAAVVLKRRPSAKAPVAQKLGVIDVVDGTGKRKPKVKASLAKGRYYLVVTYTDDTSGSSATMTRLVTIR